MVLQRQSVSLVAAIFYAMNVIRSFVNAQINMTDLMNNYINVCGPGYTCYDWHSTYRLRGDHKKSNLCPRCSCMDSCFQERTCCPDKYFNKPYSVYKSMTINYPASLTEQNVIPSSYAVVNSCPQNSNLVERYECEKEASPREILTRPPVTSTKSNVSYVNRPCAYCHFEKNEDLHEWSLTTDNKCADKGRIFYLSSYEEIFAYAKNASCVLLYVPDFTLSIQEEVLSSKDYRSRCNVSKTWRNRNHNIQKACESTENPVIEMTHPYRNVFCLFCNKRNLNSTEGDKCYIFNDIKVQAFEFVSKTFEYKFEKIVLREDSIHEDILKHTETNYTTESYIPGIMTILDKHINISNLLMKRLSLFPEAICDKRRLPLLARNQTKDDCQCHPSCMLEEPCKCCLDTALMWPIKCIPDSINTKRNPKKITVISGCHRNDNMFDGSEYYAAIRRLCENSVGRFDMFPVSSGKLSYRNIYCYLCNNKFEVTEKSLNFSSQYKAWEVNILCQRELNIYYAAKVGEIGNNLTSFSNLSVKVEGLQHAPPYIVDKWRYPFPSAYSGYLDSLNRSILQSPVENNHVSSLLFCKQNIYDKDEFTIDYKTLEIILKKTQQRFQIGQFVFSLKGKIHICQEDIQKETLSSPESDLPLQIFTLTCTGISLVCLLITFITYCLFKTLLTIPGLNLMSLVLSLFCAQLLFLFSNNQDDRIACEIVGVLLHYFWLCTCSCLFICCFHMYRVFSSQNLVRSGVSFTISTFYRYIAFSYLSPLVVVCTNVVVMFAVNGTLGYGVEICFVENVISNMVSFVAPLALTCFINCFFFFNTVRGISSSSKMRKDKISEVKTFAKLFSITGLVWLVQILDAFVTWFVLSYMATALICLQGCFIFLSFCCSKATKRLWKESSFSRLSKTDSTTLTTVEKKTIPREKDTRNVRHAMDYPIVVNAKKYIHTDADSHMN
ncbi:uncharacterized protein LOC133181511 [Saccostrea echinata]|uniref:uncharacterized protein LOC133181511 n=1 Tax=Saccostrea echinata TaxID=191078 RepID=UPI002A8038E7|nr:uncharacterized protein LOC133181511 [Saccostrea echinata]